MENNLDRKAPHIERHLITHNALIVTFFHSTPTKMLSFKDINAFLYFIIPIYISVTIL